MKAALINRLWLLSGYRKYLHFNRNMHQVEKVQRKMLSWLLHHNRETVIGQKYGFAGVSNYAQFADAVPLTEDYEELALYVEEMKSGKSNVLFPGKPLFFETTSGSTGKSKLIPYNANLKSELESGIQVWMHKLYRSDSAIFDGPAYWSVSPKLKEQGFTSAGTPVGSSEDTDYFNPLTAWMLRQMLIRAPEQHEYHSAHSFYVKTWRNLLMAPWLRFISVWSPGFLIRLHSFLAEHYDEILDGLPVAYSRKPMLRTLLSGKFTLHNLFPQLRLLSCWTQAQAGMWMPELKELLGDVRVQGKGLLSTEGLVTIPFGSDMHVLAYTGHFFEFREQESGKVYTAWQLDSGQTYEVVLTTGGGLYRYCTGDIVKCTGFIKSIPCFEFTGRGRSVCDMIGEKLYEASLAKIFDSAWKQRAITKNNQQLSERMPKMFLYAWKQHSVAGYKLLIEGELDASVIAEVTGNVDSGLKENPYYAQAMKTGQLAPLTAELCKAGFSQRLMEWYGKTRQIKDGDIKIPLLFLPGTLKNLIGY